MYKNINDKYIVYININILYAIFIQIHYTMNKITLNEWLFL